jgi:hypothetical protein
VVFLQNNVYINLKSKKMKKLSKLILREKADLLSNPEMKLIVGGGGYCHCMNGDIQPVASCSYDSCYAVCKGAVQNCNYSG